MLNSRSPGPPTQFYLKQESASYSKFLMFHNYSPNQMLMEIFGLDGNKAQMTYMFPERILRESELSAVDFLWPDAIEVNKPIEHITCHKDGTFHIKTKNKKDLYVEKMRHTNPIGPNVDVFLTFKIISEIGARFQTVSLPLEEPNAWFFIPANHALMMEGAFAGARYDLEREFMATILHRTGGGSVATPLIRLRSGTIKGLFHCYTGPIPDKSSRNKPEGTFISFKFPVENEKYALKAFFFK